MFLHLYTNQVYFQRSSGSKVEVISWTPKTKTAKYKSNTELFPFVRVLSRAVSASAAFSRPFEAVAATQFSLLRLERSRSTQKYSRASPLVLRRTVLGRERGRVVATRLALEAASGAPALVSCHMDFCAKNLHNLVTLSTIRVMGNNLATFQ